MEFNVKCGMRFAKMKKKNIWNENHQLNGLFNSENEMF